MAVTIEPQQFAASLGMQAHGIEPLLRAVSIMVLEYAEDAPDDLHNAAVIRAGAWLAQTPAASVRSHSTRSDVAEGDTNPGGSSSNETTTQYAVSEKSALIHSGAAALLTRYKRRRGGLIPGKAPAAAPAPEAAVSSIPMRMGVSSFRTLEASNLGVVGTTAGVTLPAILSKRVGFWLPDPESDTVSDFTQEGNPFD